MRHPTVELEVCSPGAHFRRRCPIRKKQSVPRLVALAAAALAVVVVAASLARPVFIDRAQVVRVIAPPSAVVPTTDSLAPWLHLPLDAALESDRFRRDREAFALDLIRTGRVNPIRARSLAEVAVREAYKQRIPPALVLGVMVTENDEFKSQARSSVGAVGLMQVYGRAWRNSLGRIYGTDLKDDETNIRYGVHILRYMTEQVPDSSGPDAGWRKALLAYNGCVHGTNTPGCRSYPDVVRQNVQRSARASCRGLDFKGCVIEPLWVAMRG